MKEYLSHLHYRIRSLSPVVWIGILLALLLLLLGISFLREPQVETPQTNQVPTEAQSNAPAKFSYPDEKVERMLELVDNRTPLSPSDQAIRDRLIASIGSESGILHETTRYTIEYVKEPDSFMVGVKTIDISSVNKDATDWFIDQGVSLEGVCRFPVVFYPSLPLEIIPDIPLLFNPIPEGC